MKSVEKPSDNAGWLAIFEDAYRSGETIAVTHEGKAYVDVVPHSADSDSVGSLGVVAANNSQHDSKQTHSKTAQGVE